MLYCLNTLVDFIFSDNGIKVLYSFCSKDWYPNCAHTPNILQVLEDFGGSYIVVTM